MKSHSKTLLTACLMTLIAVTITTGALKASQTAITNSPTSTPKQDQDIDGPPPPNAPDVLARDSTGRVTIRAVRVADPLNIDGILDERAYRDVQAISDFIQVEPVYRVAPTERTEAWVLFDHNYLYVSAKCFDSSPESQWVANEMRRDSMNVLQNENFAILIDPFYDRRSGIILNINALGGRMDGQMTDERVDTYNGDWNPIWELKVGRFEHGWTVEAAIPFKSLQYRPGQDQIWGLNLRRYVKWKNEVAFLSPVSEGRSVGGIFQSSMAATLVGLEVPDESMTFEIKPYAITDLTSIQTAPKEIQNNFNADVGIDLKYGITQNLLADITVNTDFAQVEADEQQVNLTRFSLFFPEKREFFLENQGLFAFGGTGTGPYGGAGETPILFYSREIGLNQGLEVPIVAGGRLTGRVGKFSLGALNIQTDKTSSITTANPAASTNFSVIRFRRDVLQRSSIGMIFTGRSVSRTGIGSTQTFGLDGVFSFYENLNINTYWAKTSTPELSDDDQSYRAQLDYTGDRYGLQLEHLVVGNNFNPEVGFLRRDNFERSFGYFRFSPRPRSISAIRKFSWEGHLDYITDRSGILETREAQGQFLIEFENSDEFKLSYTRSHEFLDRAFPITPTVIIPTGRYSFQSVNMSFTLGLQRTLSGMLSGEHGSFFGGQKTSVGFTAARLELTPQFSIEPGLSLNWVELPVGQFTAELVTARTTYTVTPLMFVSALLQYNSSNTSLSTNVRLRWEYQSGSELFVVYNEQRDTLSRSFPTLNNRAFVIKINRLFRF